MRARDVGMVARRQLLVWLLVAALNVQGQFVAVGRARAAAPCGPQSQVDAEGVAHVLAIKVSASKFMSAEARTKLIRLFSGPRPPSPADMRLCAAGRWNPRARPPRGRALRPRTAVA
jgi:hypothetical protein